MGALSPDELWWAVQTQVREIVFSVFQWDEGQFHFEESVLPEKEKITVDLDVTALVLEGVRRMDPGGRGRGPATPTATSWSSRARRRPEGLLHPWEDARALPRGRREERPRALPRERGGRGADPEGPLRLPLHRHRAPARPEGARPRPGLRARGHRPRRARLLQPDVPARPRVHGEGGRPHRRERPREVPEHRPRVAARGPRGGHAAQGRLARRGGGRAQPRPPARGAAPGRRLVDALNELLYAELLAVKRTLGADHESAIVRDLRPPR